MRALLRDREDQTYVAFEAEEAIYDPEEQTLGLYAASGAAYLVSHVRRGDADAMIEALAATGYCDMTAYAAGESD